MCGEKKQTNKIKIKVRRVWWASISLNTNSRSSKVFSGHSTNGCLGYSVNNNKNFITYRAKFSVSRSKVTICCYQWHDFKSAIRKSISKFVYMCSNREMVPNHLSVKENYCYSNRACENFVYKMRPRHKSSSHTEHVSNWVYVDFTHKQPHTHSHAYCISIIQICNDAKKIQYLIHISVLIHFQEREFNF